jgi:hypothetical protein
LARLSLDAGDRDRARSAFDRARAASRLGRKAGLTEYQRELLRAPAWQVEEISRGLAAAPQTSESVVTDVVQ